MLDVIGLLYVIQIVAKFYKIQYVHIKQDVVSCLCLFQISLGMFLPKISRIKRNLTKI